jgi:hypothetical protein
MKFYIIILTDLDLVAEADLPEGGVEAVKGVADLVQRLCLVHHQFTCTSKNKNFNFTVLTFG